MEGDTILTAPANPGLNGTATLLLNAPGASIASRNERRCMVFVFADQVVTVKYSVRAEGGQWRAANGAGDATTANTSFFKDYILQGDDQKIELVTTTAPTVWEVSGRLVSDRAAAV